MDPDRQALKIQLGRRYGHVCPLCGAPAYDLHEVFVPKGHVMAMAPERRLEINHRYNCIMVCNACNIAMTRWMQEALALRLLIRAGYEAVGDDLELAEPAPGPHPPVRLAIRLGYERITAWVADRRYRVPPRVEARLSTRVVDKYLKK